MIIGTCDDSTTPKVTGVRKVAMTFCTSDRKPGIYTLTDAAYLLGS